MPLPITILLADDHQMFLDGIQSILDDIEDIRILGQANDGPQVMQQLAKVQPDILLIDIAMPRTDGLQVAEEVAKKYPDVKVIMVSMHDKQEFVLQSLEVGAKGYLLKNTGQSQLVQAIREVADGGTFFSQGLMEKVFAQFGREKKKQKVKEEANLSEREIEVLKLITEELTNQEIAKKLFLSTYTVETHRKNLLSKVGVRNTAGLVGFAYRMGIVPLEQNR